MQQTTGENTTILMFITGVCVCICFTKHIHSDIFIIPEYLLNNCHQKFIFIEILPTQIV